MASAGFHRTKVTVANRKVFMHNRTAESNIKKIVCMIMMIVLTLSSIGFSQSSYAEEDKQEKKEKELEKVQEEKKDVYEELNKLAKDIQDQQAAIEEVKASIGKKNKQISKTKKALKLMKKEIKERKDGLDNRLRAMYKNGVVGYLDIILNSNDVEELITNVDMVQKIYKADQDTLDTLVEERMQIEAQEATLKQEKAELDSKESDLSYKEAQLKETNEKLNKKYAALKAEEEKLQTEIQEIIQAKQVAAEGGYVALPGKYKGGKWVCPVWTNYYVNRYGNYLSGRSYESHPGIDMAAPTGTPIHAAANGVVIKAGWYGGYGNAVILSHGSGLTSLYGHNSSVTVKVGQKVKKGDVIAKMGSTGFSTGSHCHFEVRQNGALRNPRDFCYIHGPNS